MYSAITRKNITWVSSSVNVKHVFHTFKSSFWSVHQQRTLFSPLQSWDFCNLFYYPIQFAIVLREIPISIGNFRLLTSAINTAPNPKFLRNKTERGWLYWLSFCVCCIIAKWEVSLLCQLSVKELRNICSATKIAWRIDPVAENARNTHAANDIGAAEVQKSQENWSQST
jgi:hypothetical protein